MPHSSGGAVGIGEQTGGVGKPEQLGDMLKQAFEEHVHSVDLSASIYHCIDLSKKVMRENGNLD